MRRTAHSWSVLLEVSESRGERSGGGGGGGSGGDGGGSSTDSASKTSSRMLTMWLVRTHDSAEEIRSRAPPGPPAPQHEKLGSIPPSAPAAIECTLTSAMRFFPPEPPADGPHTHDTNKQHSAALDWWSFDRHRSDWMFANAPPLDSLSSSITADAGAADEPRMPRTEEMQRLQQLCGPSPSLLHMGSGKLIRPRVHDDPDDGLTWKPACVDLRLLWKDAHEEDEPSPYALIERSRKVAPHDGPLVTCFLQCWRAERSLIQQTRRKMVNAYDRHRRSLQALEAQTAHCASDPKVQAELQRGWQLFGELEEEGRRLFHGSTPPPAPFHERPDLFIPEPRRTPSGADQLHLMGTSAHDDKALGLLRGWPANKELRGLSGDSDAPIIFRFHRHASASCLQSTASWRFVVVLDALGVHILDFLLPRALQRRRGAQEEVRTVRPTSGAQL